VYWWLPVFFLGFFMWAIGSQWPSNRIRNQRVRVVMGLDLPRDGTVLDLERSDYRPAATVLLDGERHPITVPLESLIFSWWSRLTRFLPRRFRV
jgi:hypothetical protein